MQNAAFAELELDWAYVPLPVSAHELEQAIAGLRAVGFVGANVTIPHKTTVLGLCDELSAVAERAGSVNTLVFTGSATHGTSTDGLAVTEAVACAGENALLLGAGGAAQAVATAIVDAGIASLTIGARTRERAEALTARISSLGSGVRVRTANRWPPGLEDATLVINATPLKNVTPIDLRPGLKVVDLAYRPDRAATAMVSAARQLGSPVVVDGLEVLVRQGAASFACWTGIEAPIDTMRRAIRQAEP